MSKRQLILLLIFILVLGAGRYWWKSREADKDAAPPAPGPVPVKVIDAAPRDIPVYMTGLGNVQSMNRVTVRAQVEGELTKLHFNEGDNVKKGDLLASIDDRQIRAELSRAEAEKARAQAQLYTGQQDLTRYENLLREDAIARQLVEQQRATVQQLSAAVQVAQAAIDNAQVRLSFTRITAPISGTVGLRFVDAGNIVRAADPNGLVAITQMDPIAVFFTLPQSGLGDLVPLMKDKDRPVDILPKEGAAPTATGQLQTIDNQIDASTGTIRLKVIVPNEEKQLWPGQFVVARIRTHIYEGVIAVPMTAIQHGQNGKFVYRVRDNKAEIVPVNIIYEDPEQAVIEGVELNDKIIIDGQTRIKPNSAIQIIADPIKPQEKTEEDSEETAS